MPGIFSQDLSDGPSGRNAIRSASGSVAPVVVPRGEAYFRRIINRGVIERAAAARRRIREADARV